MKDERTYPMVFQSVTRNLSNINHE
jgi:hypothetical protein